MNRKIIAAVLTGAILTGAFSVNVFADEDKTISVAASATPHA